MGFHSMGYQVSRLDLSTDEISCLQFTLYNGLLFFRRGDAGTFILFLLAPSVSSERRRIAAA